MRVADRNEGNASYHSQTRRCAARDCPGSTREGKPFCSEHVGLNSYASEVMQKIAQRDAEDALALSPNTAPEDYNVAGVTAQSILQQLEERGTRTKERLCRELGLDRELVDAYADALIMRGLVRIGRTGRGCETLSLR